MIISLDSPFCKTWCYLGCKITRRWCPGCTCSVSWNWSWFVAICWCFRCGERIVHSWKGHWFWDNKIQEKLCSRLSPLWLPSMSQLMGIPFLLYCSCRPSLHPLQPGTEVLAQCLQFSAASLIGLFRSDQEISEYLISEWRGTGARGWSSFLMWHEREWHSQGWRAFAGSGLQVCCLPSSCLPESQGKLSHDCQVPKWESSCLLKTLRAAVFHTCWWITICPVVQHLVRSYCCHPHLSPLLKKRSACCSLAGMCHHSLSGWTCGLCCHPTGSAGLPSHHC